MKAGVVREKENNKYKPLITHTYNCLYKKKRPDVELFYLQLQDWLFFVGVVLFISS